MRGMLTRDKKSLQAKSIWEKWCKMVAAVAVVIMQINRLTDLHEWVMLKKICVRRSANANKQAGLNWTLFQATGCVTSTARWTRSATLCATPTSVEPTGASWRVAGSSLVASLQPQQRVASRPRPASTPVDRRDNRRPHACDHGHPRKISRVDWKLQHRPENRGPKKLKERKMHDWKFRTRCQGRKMQNRKMEDHLII